MSIMGYRYETRSVDMVIYHIDMVILDINMGYGPMIWEITVSMCSSAISIWDILSLWLQAPPANEGSRVGGGGGGFAASID